MKPYFERQWCSSEITRPVPAKHSSISMPPGIHRLSQKPNLLFPSDRSYQIGGEYMTLCITSILFGMIFCSSVSASEWTKQAAKDRLTGKTEVSFIVRGKGAITQFGRDVTAALILSCINIYQNPEKHRDADEYSAVIRFSERIGFVETSFRYRFDKGDVRRITASLSDRGNILYASWPKAINDSFISELKSASVLRAEIDLPWAGRVLLEFATSGADAAMSAIPCGSNDSQVSGVMLGIRPIPLAQALSAGLQSDAPSGLYILQVDQGVAERAGVMKGDVIVAYDDDPVANYDDLRALMERTKPGSTVLLSVWRSGKLTKIRIEFR